ncbi:TIGR03032 family protein [Methylocucumis oryzae]|nr:TIGR03032 family protein [Methylocucumis oryzae]
MTHPTDNSENALTRPQQEVTMAGSEGLWDWLNDLNISLAFTTYQTNRLFLLGCKPDGRLGVNERLFDKPMGLYASNDSLYMACRYQLWQLENRLGKDENYLGYDKLYVPSRSFTTGDLNVHDLVMTKTQKLLFINTDFSCLATLKSGYSFEPIWQPPFISKLVAEDRCHLNGLAMQNGEPTYVTACSTTDSAAGWRDCRVDGGVVIHIPSNEIICTGLSMPHSPRWYRSKLWLLNSGTGEFGYVAGGRFVPVTFCPGFVRGLAFVGDYALVGLSKLRSKTFAGLGLETRLAAEGQTSQCGLMVIDLTTGTVINNLQIEGAVEELFDIVVLPNIRLPRALGFQDDDIDRLINFPNSGGIIVTKPTVKRPGIGKSVQAAGLPRAAQLANPSAQTVKYQRVYHLTPDNLLPYEAMTYPSLRNRWQTQAQRGELFGVSASIAGEMVGFAVAEKYATDTAEPAAELLSLFVLPLYRHQGIGTALVKHMEKLLGNAATDVGL